MTLWLLVNDVDNFALFTFKFYSSCETYKDTVVSRILATV
jgi:hypothetical protein